jgi:hypothetical protein
MFDDSLAAFRDIPVSCTTAQFGPEIVPLFDLHPSDPAVRVDKTDPETDGHCKNWNGHKDKEEL